MSKPMLFLLYPIWIQTALLLLSHSVICIAVELSPAQNSHNEQVLLPYIYLERADSLQNIQNFDNAEKNIKKAQSIYQNKGEWIAYIDCYILLSKLYEKAHLDNKNKACLQKAITEGKKYLGEDHKSLGHIYKHKGEYLFSNGQFKKAKDYTQQAARIFALKHLWEDYTWCMYLQVLASYYTGLYNDMECALIDGLVVAIELPETKRKIDLLANLYHSQGVLYETKGNFNQAMKESQKALVLYKKRGDSNAIGAIYNNIGAIFFAKSDYKQAINFLNRSIDIYKKISGENSIDCAEIYANIGLAHLYQKEFEEALRYFDKSLQITQTDVDDRSLENTIICYNNLSQAYLHLEKSDSSLYFAQKAFEINRFNLWDLNITYEQMSAVYRNQKNYKEALRLGQAALNISKNKYGDRHPRVAISYTNLAKVHYGLNQLDTALHYCQQALIAVSLQFNKEDIQDNPTLEDVNDKNTFQKILDLKGELFALLFQQKKKDRSLLVSALNSFELAIEVIDGMRHDFQTEASKHTLAANALPIYEKSIQVALELSNLEDTPAKTPSKITVNYLKKAFLFAEKNKATILLESIKESKALLFGNIPQSILNREELLKRDMSFYERKLFEEKQKSIENADTSKISLWKTKIFDLKQEYQTLSDTLELFYPDYYHLKYDIEVASIEALQKQLTEKGDVLLEYFVGKKDVYVFIITSNTIEVKSIPNNHLLEQHFQTLLQNLRVNPFQTKDMEKSYWAYLYSAHWIFQYLVENMLPSKNSLQDIGQLTVIPDGIMGYIPFEALLMTYPQNINKIGFELHNLDYLIKKYSISYAYSATLLLEGLETDTRGRNKKENYVGFAPVFEERGSHATVRKNGSCLSSELQELKASKREVEQLGEMMKGTVFLKEEATKDNFIKYGANGYILHLATHACLSEKDPMFNTIHFVTDYLSTYELFNIRLDVDLAILSACNTGSGTLRPGEGIMSLSKGFLYAGCPSIVTSLWNVNDQAAADIILNFHANLLEGQSKNDALRSAKLQYLQTEPNRLLAPYFWATFVHIGNPQPLELKTSSMNWMSWVGILSILIGLCLIATKRWWNKKELQTL